MLRTFFETQTTGVLATEQGRQPYANLVAYSYSDDLKRLVFATPVNTTKYNNLADNPRVSMIMDSRKNDPLDFTGSMAVTAVGVARELMGEERVSLMLRHSKRLPGLSDFLDSVNIALFEIEVHTYVIVKGLDDVSIYMLKD